MNIKGATFPPLKSQHKPIRLRNLMTFSQWPIDQMVQQDDKESFGFSPSPTPTPSLAHSWSQANCQLASSGSKDSSNKENSPDISIIRPLRRSTRRNLLPQLLECLEPESMPNSPGPKPLKPMSTSKTPEWESLSNSEPNPFVETPELIGNPCGPQPSQETSHQFPQTSEWYLITPCEQSTVIMQSLVLLTAQLPYTMDVQEAVNT